MAMQLPIFGFVVGLLVGLTGMGGGVIMTPLLMLGLGMPATAAVGTDLAYAAPTKLVGAWQHWKQGTVDVRVARDLALGSVPAALIAVGALAWLQVATAEQTELWLKRLIGLVLIVAALLMLHRLLQGVGSRTFIQTVAYRRQRVIAVGIIGGFLVGLTSIGSGSLIMALLVVTIALPPDRLIGTDVLHAAVLVGTAAVAHLALGEVDLAVAGSLLIGSIPGVLIGSRLVLRVRRRPLQCLLVALLLVTGAPLTLAG